MLRWMLPPTTRPAMPRLLCFLSLFLLAAPLSASLAAAQDAGDASAAQLQTTAFTGAVVWPGGEAAPIDGATLLVRGGRVTT